MGNNLVVTKHLRIKGS